MWYRSEGDGRAPRFEYEGWVISSFEVTGPQVFGASIAWSRANGAIEVIFAERNTEFSDEGKLLLRKLVEQLLEMYGDRVVIAGEDAVSGRGHR
jgi:hypothetical protein